MSDNMQMDANDVINNLLQQIAQISQEKAMLQVQLSAALMRLKQGTEDANDDTT